MDELIFLDTETTGNNLLDDRLFQVCYKHNTSVHSEYFKPPVPISIKSQSITHVTNKMVADKQAFADSAMKEELSALLKNGILVAHNAVFDITMLMHEGVSVPRFIDTLKLARALDREGVIPEYNLQYLRYYLELDVEAKAHEAEDDVMVLEALFQRLNQKMLTEVPEQEKVIEDMMSISREPSIMRKFTFGKYRGKKVEEVLISEPGYLEWLLEQKQQNMGDGDEDWIYTLKYYLKVS